jgi:hypothetical protein
MRSMAWAVALCEVPVDRWTQPVRVGKYTNHCGRGRRRKTIRRPFDERG